MTTIPIRVLDKLRKDAKYFDSRKDFLDALESLYGDKIQVSVKKNTKWRDTPTRTGTFLNCIAALAYGGKCNRKVVQPDSKMKRALKQLNTTIVTDKDIDTLLDIKPSVAVAGMGSISKSEALALRLASTKTENAETLRDAIEFVRLLDIDEKLKPPSVNSNKTVNELRDIYTKWQMERTADELGVIALAMSSGSEIDDRIVRAVSNRIQSTEQQLGQIQKTLTPAKEKLEKLLGLDTLAPSKRTEIGVCLKQLETFQRKMASEDKQDTRRAVGAAIQEKLTPSSKAAQVVGVGLGGIALMVLIPKFIQWLNDKRVTSTLEQKNDIDMLISDLKDPNASNEEKLASLTNIKSIIDTDNIQVLYNQLINHLKGTEKVKLDDAGLDVDLSNATIDQLQNLTNTILTYAVPSYTRQLLEDEDLQQKLIDNVDFKHVSGEDNRLNLHIARLFLLWLKDQPPGVTVNADNRSAYITWLHRYPKDQLKQLAVNQTGSTSANLNKFVETYTSSAESM